MSVAPQLIEGGLGARSIKSVVGRTIECCGGLSPGVMLLLFPNETSKEHPEGMRMSETDKRFEAAG